MSPDPDLFEWAACRVVIDARRLFLHREVAFIKKLIIGYRPPTSGGAPPISLDAYREVRAASEPGQERMAVQ